MVSLEGLVAENLVLGKEHFLLRARPCPALPCPGPHVKALY